MTFMPTLPELTAAIIAESIVKRVLSLISPFLQAAAQEIRRWIIVVIRLDLPAEATPA